MNSIMGPVVIALLLVSSATAAADYEAGQAAYERGDFTAAFEVWLPLAEQGYASAQFAIGEMYACGKGVSEDDVEAEKWYRKAAEQGNPMAQFSLGMMYDDGVPENNAEAAKWYRKAVEQGNEFAELFLYETYVRAGVEPENDEEATRWWRKGNEDHIEQFRWHNINLRAQASLFRYLDEQTDRDVP